MIDDVSLSLIYATWLAVSTMPLGLMLGSPCSSCCGNECGDSKPVTDPEDEGTWVPSGTWLGAGGVTWTFNANPGDSSGETWFFFGSLGTSKAGGGATTEEQQDWGNLCNWYSSKTNSPSTVSGAIFDKRASRLPPSDAVVHIYSDVSTALVGAQTVKHIYFWSGRHLAGSEITTTAGAHDSAYGAVFTGPDRPFNFGIINQGATFNPATVNAGTVHGGATFNGLAQLGSLFDPELSSQNGRSVVGSVVAGTVNGGAVFQNRAQNTNGTVNGGATFDFSGNTSIVNDGATFTNEGFNAGTVNGGATFGSGGNFSGGIVNDGATFNNNSINSFGTVNGGATFNDSSVNSATVNGGATFNDTSINSDSFAATVNGGATFNDAACSQRTVGVYAATPCTRKFVAHPTDLPTCNGTANDGCHFPQVFCGCG